MALPQLEATEGIQTGILRDDLSLAGTNPPSNAQYGADLLANNTKAILSLTVGGAVVNSSPRFDSFVGLKLHSNPATAANCTVATGYAQFADFQKSTNAAGANSPVYPDNVIAPWRVDINSNSCEAAKNPNKVTITGVGLYFPVLGAEARGTITGLYEQPGANCTAGGVKLDLAQGGLVLSSGGAAGISDGAGGNAYLCFVSADNYVYPTTPTGLGAVTGKIKNN